jgi:RES domain-containing protein
MTPKPVRLPDRRIWLRLADPDWTDPVDPSFAHQRGGRWNRPSSFPTLYLNGDLDTARLQIERLLTGSPVRPEDLDDAAYELVAVTLPRSQTCADAVSEEGLKALGLPGTYPISRSGKAVPHQVCQRVGEKVHSIRFRGVWCRSACSPDGRGRELAWFPATGRSRARVVGDQALPFGAWKNATDWADLGLEPQRDPE